jgi:hypothetical protein
MLVDLIRGSPVRGEVTTARLPRSVGADVAGPLVLRKIAAGAKTEGGDQSLFVDKPELDLALKAAIGEPAALRRRLKLRHRLTQELW